MFLNRTHPDFDLGMELLCTLSTAIPASLATLAADLGFDGSQAAGKAVRDLADRGYQVKTAHGEKDEGNVAYIERGGGDQAREACEAYWKSVYGSSRVKTKAA